MQQPAEVTETEGLSFPEGAGTERRRQVIPPSLCPPRIRGLRRGGSAFQVTGLLGAWEGTLPSLDVQWRIGDWQRVEKQLSPTCPLGSNRTLVRRSPREMGDIQTEERERGSETTSGFTSSRVRRRLTCWDGGVCPHRRLHGI